MTAGRSLTVVALCAAWCRTCDEFRPAFERIARERPHDTFVWLDTEDEEAIVGDIDVENFPTLAIFDAGLPVHYGVSLPHEALVRRLVEMLSTQPGAPIAAAEAVATLPQRIARRAR